MKTKSILIICICLGFNCSSSDDGGNNTYEPPEEVINSFDPISIKFVHEDGAEITSGECIESNAGYAVQIETTKNSKGNTQVSEVQYTVNGVLYSMTFSQAGTKKNPIVLAEGDNIAQLVVNAIDTDIRYIAQGDFTLVE